MENEFVLCQGVSVMGADKLRSCYKSDENGASGLLSGDVIVKAAEEFIKSIPEPIFFFLELPNENDNFDVYYLDNCTRKVAFAIIKRYGTLLAQDGCSRFGFGSHKTDEEIYFTDYQEFMLYTTDVRKTETIMKVVGAEKTDEPMYMWDLFSDENPGCLSVVEAEGETVYDIPENLRSAGMYKAQ